MLLEGAGGLLGLDGRGGTPRLGWKSQAQNFQAVNSWFIMYISRFIASLLFSIVRPVDPSILVDR